MKRLRWSFLQKIVDCIQPITIFGKHFILGVSQGHEYASDEAKQSPSALPLIPQKSYECSLCKFLPLLNSILSSHYGQNTRSDFTYMILHI